MALPKIDSPIYDLELPLSKHKIRFRPFLVKEQKNLLMAMESNDSDSIEKNIKQVLTNCTLTEKFDVDSLPVLDIEYYFLNLRARSVGEVVENKYRCDNQITTEAGDVKSCGNVMESSLNILDIKVQFNKENQEVVQLTSTISVRLKYPQFSVLKKLKDLSSASDIAIQMIADSIDYIYDSSVEQFYYSKEATNEELVEFIGSLSQQQFSLIEEFFANMPKMEKKIEMRCSKCGFEHSIDVEGLENFFV
jgi:hypothetical protein